MESERNQLRLTKNSVKLGTKRYLICIIIGFCLKSTVWFRLFAWWNAKKTVFLNVFQQKNESRGLGHFLWWHHPSYIITVFHCFFVFFFWILFGFHVASIETQKKTKQRKTLKKQAEFLNKGFTGFFLGLTGIDLVWLGLTRFDWVFRSSTGF